MSGNVFTSVHPDFENGVAYAVTVKDSGEVKAVDAVELPDADEARSPDMENDGRFVFG